MDNVTCQRFKSLPLLLPTRSMRAAAFPDNLSTIQRELPVTPVFAQQSSIVIPSMWRT